MYKNRKIYNSNSYDVNIENIVLADNIFWRDDFNNIKYILYYLTIDKDGFKVNIITDIILEDLNES